ncbi:MAG: hypothetical protein QOG76_5367, partial [Pseudonocardiales bacterium]|nr:hypothetical protein [Pseudonocardiales bacterium]
DTIVGRNFAASADLMKYLVEQGRREGSITTRGSAEGLTSAIYNAWLGVRVRVRAGEDPVQLRAERPRCADRAGADIRR